MCEFNIELTKKELESSLIMAHFPTGKNAASCGNCQGACYCRCQNDPDFEIENLL